MNLKLTKFFLAVFSICLLAGLSIGAITASAQSIRVDPFVLRLVETGPASMNVSQPTSLIFVVKDDGSTLIAVDRKIPNPSDIYLYTDDIIWQQAGMLTSDQLDQVTAAQKSLLSIPDQYWPNKAYAIDFPISSKIGDNKRIQLNNHLKRGDQTALSELQNTIQTLLDIRKQFEPLVAFGWSGGFGRRATQLTVQADGRLTYEDHMRRTTVIDKMTQQDMGLVQQLIHAPAFQTYPAVVKQNCTNCWSYSVVTLTQDGLKTAEFDQNTLETGPQSLKTLITLFVDLSDQEALIKITTTPLPSSTPTPASPDTVKPTSTRIGAATPKHKPTVDQWESKLTETDNHIELDVLETSDDVFMGAVRRFQLQPGTVPTECVVFIIHGPMALAVGLFGPGWVERRSDLTDAMIAQRVQDGIDTLSQYCDKDKISVLRVP